MNSSAEIGCVRMYACNYIDVNADASVKPVLKNSQLVNRLSNVYHGAAWAKKLPMHNIKCMEALLVSNCK